MAAAAIAVASTCQAAPALTRLRLQDFRNYPALDIAIDGQAVVLFGPNGAGKTNLLEAISLLSPGRGLRRAALEEIDRDHAGPWRVQAQLAHHDGPLDLNTRRDQQTGRRLIQLNDRPLKGPAALAELLSVTWLTPLMDRLFLEAAASRRRFLDRMVLTIQPDHATRVGAYERSLRERVAILRGGRHDAAWLDALERRIAETGTAIAAARLTLIDALNPILAEPALELPRLKLAINGATETILLDRPALDAETKLIDQLKQCRAHDRQSGGAAAGPHRSDLLVTDLTTDEPAGRVSTGRQKSILLSIILGEARLRQRRLGDLPIILMDEVAAHLDSQRRQQLCQTLLDLGAQVFLTGTDRQLFAPLEGAAQFLDVDHAIIRQQAQEPGDTK